MSLDLSLIMSFFVGAPDFAPYEGCIGEWREARSFVGKGKSFGYFGCFSCEKTWMSAHAKKGFKQGCKSCGMYFYPLYLWENTYKNYNKKDKSLNDNGKPHITELCQACQKGVCFR